MLGWQENLTEDEMPPEWMWPFEEKLESWFEEVKRVREAKYKPGSGSTDEVAPMMDNELAQGLRD